MILFCLDVYLNSVLPTDSYIEIFFIYKSNTFYGFPIQVKGS